MPDGAAAPTPTETIHVNHPVVACDGGDGALGHPRVFLRIEDRETVTHRLAMCEYGSMDLV